METVALPNPVFEGSEKRVEVDFSWTANSNSSLRHLIREQLDELMTLAACTIVSSRSNADFDAYVLSESSLFVYPQKWILKTCGTTKLLNSVPRLLEMAKEQGLEPQRCKFSRACYLFPEQQLFPHVHFDEEVRYLDQSFGQLGTGGHAYKLGNPDYGLQWHVYVADANHNCHVSPRPTYNVEVCMTDLSCSAAKQFFRSHKAAAEVTEGTGIRQIKPKAVIDDYVFEPCGYSMNGIDGSGLMTIHITPETGFSYASIEVSGCWDDVLCPADLLAKAVKIFEPAKISLALTVDKGVGKEAGKRRESSAQAGFGELAYLPCGYSTFSTSSQPLPGGGKVTYYNVALDRSSAPGSPITVLGVEGSSSSSAFTSDSDVEAELA